MYRAPEDVSVPERDISRGRQMALRSLKIVDLHFLHRRITFLEIWFRVSDRCIAVVSFGRFVGCFCSGLSV